MPSVGGVELHVTVKCMKILSVAQQCFYSKFSSPATINLNAGLQVNTRSCIETKEFSFGDGPL